MILVYLQELFRGMFGKESKKVTSSPSNGNMFAKAFLEGTSAPVPIGNSLRARGTSSNNHRPILDRLSSTGEMMENPLVEDNPLVDFSSWNAEISEPMTTGLIEFVSRHESARETMKDQVISLSPKDRYSPLPEFHASQPFMSSLNPLYPCVQRCQMVPSHATSSSSPNPITNMAQALSSTHSVPWMCYSPIASSQNLLHSASPSKTSSSVLPKASSTHASQPVVSTTTQASSSVNTALQTTMSGENAVSSSPKKEDCFTSIASSSEEKKSCAGDSCCSESSETKGCDSQIRSSPKSHPEQCNYRLTMQVRSSDSESIEMDSPHTNHQATCADQPAKREMNVQVQFTPLCSAKSSSEKGSDTDTLKLSPRKRTSSQSSLSSSDSSQSFTVTFQSSPKKNPPSNSKFNVLIEERSTGDNWATEDDTDEDEDEKDEGVEEDKEKTASNRSKCKFFISPSNDTDDESLASEDEDDKNDQGVKEEKKGKSAPNGSKFMCFISPRPSMNDESSESEDEDDEEDKKASGGSKPSTSWCSKPSTSGGACGGSRFFAMIESDSDEDDDDDDDDEDEGWDELSDNENGAKDDLWDPFSNQGLLNLSITCSITPTVKRTKTASPSPLAAAANQSSPEAEAPLEMSPESVAKIQQWEAVYGKVAVPAKSSSMVSFASPDNGLATVHKMVTWDYAYRAARLSPWMQYGRDEERFNRKIEMELKPTLSPVLSPEHRARIFAERFESVV